MLSSFDFQENKEEKNYLSSCDKCDTMQQIIESKMFIVIRDFSQFAKVINEEQSNMSITMNNTINTVNMLIDQFEENKAALFNAKNEIENLKSEIQKIKSNNNDSLNNVKNKSVTFSSQYNAVQFSNDSINNDIDSIKTEMTKLKQDLQEYKTMQHDICCLKYEVKKLKLDSNMVEPSIRKYIQSDEQFSKVDKVESINIRKASTDSETSIIETLNLQQNSINSLINDVKKINENYATQDGIKKIKKQIKKLNNKVDSLESRNANKLKNNNGSEEESINIKDQEEKDDSDDILNSIQNLNLRLSTLESETKKITDTITKPKVQQIFVDLPNSRACNLLFRSPNLESSNKKV